MTQEPSTVVLDPAEVPDWDQRVALQPGATVFHTAGWAAVLSESYGFRARYVVAQEGGHWRGVLPLMEVAGLRGGRRGVSLPFTDHCPWLLPEGETAGDPSARFWQTPGASEMTLSDRLLAGVRAEAAARGWGSVEFRPSPVSGDVGLPPASSMFASHELPLLGSDQAQAGICGGAMRRCLRQAAEAALPVSVGAEPAMVREYYRLHCLTRRRQGAPPQPWRFFENLQKRLLAAGQGFVVLVGRIPVAGALFLRFGRRAVYKFGASSGEQLEARPNQSALWTGFRHAASLGCEVMDLGRTSLENQGLRRFKQAWGSLETRLTYQCLDLHRRSLKPLSDRTHGWQVAWFKRLPLWVSRLIGQWVYRYAA